jgi:hypothetical protein
MVRGKSELVIANHLFDVGPQFSYERPLEGAKAPGRLRPDFSFVTDAGDVIVWEHLGGKLIWERSVGVDDELVVQFQMQSVAQTERR